MFWGVLLLGLLTRELSLRAGAPFLAAYFAGLLGAARLPWLPFSTFVAILDIALVFKVAKGDVRIS